jgi:hypothetical protein
MVVVIHVENHEALAQMIFGWGGICRAATIDEASYRRMQRVEGQFCQLLVEVNEGRSRDSAGFECLCILGRMGRRWVAQQKSAAECPGAVGCLLETRERKAAKWTESPDSLNRAATVLTLPISLRPQQRDAALILGSKSNL